MKAHVDDAHAQPFETVRHGRGEITLSLISHDKILQGEIMSTLVQHVATLV